MTKYQERLERMAQTINEMEKLAYEIRINRRNGMYAIDKYDTTNGKYHGAFKVRDFKEVENYLLGMANAIYYTKSSTTTIK